MQELFTRAEALLIDRRKAIVDLLISFWKFDTKTFYATSTAAGLSKYNTAIALVVIYVA